MLGPLFANVQRIARAVENGLGADGTFVATNNRVSQSVPHVHVHVVPRRKKDGLQGLLLAAAEVRERRRRARDRRRYSQCAEVTHRLRSLAGARGRNHHRASSAVVDFAGFRGAKVRFRLLRWAKMKPFRGLAGLFAISLGLSCLNVGGSPTWPCPADCADDASRSKRATDGGRCVNRAALARLHRVVDLVGGRARAHASLPSQARRTNPHRRILRVLEHRATVGQQRALVRGSARSLRRRFLQSPALHVSRRSVFHPRTGRHRGRACYLRAARRRRVGSGVGRGR